MDPAAVVRRIYAAMNADELATVEDLIDAQIVWRWPSNVAGGGTFQGREAFIRGGREWREAWGSFRFDVEEIAVHGERALATVRYRASGRASGLELDAPVGHLWRIREGRAIELRMMDPERARALLAQGDG